MSEPREVKLPSGATLKIGLAPFSESKALYQAILKELKDVELTSDKELSAVFKDVFCVGFSSPIIEKCLDACFKRCTIDDLKIDKDTFEAPERRQDYTLVCVEVTKENVAPFMKSLFADFEQFMSIVGNIQPSRQETTTS